MQMLAMSTTTCTMLHALEGLINSHALTPAIICFPSLPHLLAHLCLMFTYQAATFIVYLDNLLIIGVQKGVHCF